MALKCNEQLRRSTARQRGGEAKHRKARDATEQHSAAKRSGGKAWQSHAMHGDGVATRRSAMKREGFALLSFAMRRQR